MSTSTPVATSEEDGGFTGQRLAMLAAHLFFSVAHIFAVHQSAEPHDDETKAAAQAASLAGDNTPEAKGRGYRYSPAMVVLLAEVLKLVASAVLYVFEVWRDTKFDWHQRLRNEIAEAIVGWRVFRFALPAVVYLVENHIRFLVLKSLASPVTWVVFSHVEIPIVAVMSFFFLSRPLTRAQTIAIVLLLDGVMASEISLCHARENQSCDALSDYPLEALALVLLGALLAAMAGISVEYMYKEEYHTSIHLQNVQLYAFGVVANAAVVLIKDTERIANPGREPNGGVGVGVGVSGGGVVEDGVVGVNGVGGVGSGGGGGVRGGAFEGFDSEAYLVVTTLAAFGLVTSLVVKHLSNIAKVFNSATGIVVTAALSWIFLGTAINLTFVLAATVVISSLFLFYADKGRGGGGGGGGVKNGGAGHMIKPKGGVGGGGGGGGGQSMPSVLLQGGVRSAMRSLGAVTVGAGDVPKGAVERVQELNHLL